jgi:ribosomal protein S27E
MIKNIHEVNSCPECGSENIIYKDEEQQVICEDCGMIFEPLGSKEEEEEFEEVAGIEEKPSKEKTPAKKPAKKKGKKKR